MISVRTDAEETNVLTFRTIPGSPRRFRLSQMFVLAVAGDLPEVHPAEA